MALKNVKNVEKVMLLTKLLTELLLVLKPLILMNMTDVDTEVYLGNVLSANMDTMTIMVSAKKVMLIAQLLYKL